MDSGRSKEPYGHARGRGRGGYGRGGGGGGGSGVGGADRDRERGDERDRYPFIGNNNTSGSTTSHASYNTSGASHSFSRGPSSSQSQRYHSPPMSSAQGTSGTIRSSRSPPSRLSPPPSSMSGSYSRGSPGYAAWDRERERERETWEREGTRGGRVPLSIPPRSRNEYSSGGRLSGPRLDRDRDGERDRDRDRDRERNISRRFDRDREKDDWDWDRDQRDRERRSFPSQAGDHRFATSGPGVHRPLNHRSSFEVPYRQGGPIARKRSRGNSPDDGVEYKRGEHFTTQRPRFAGTIGLREREVSSPDDYDTSKSRLSAGRDVLANRISEGTAPTTGIEEEDSNDGRQQHNEKLHKATQSHVTTSSHATAGASTSLLDRLSSKPYLPPKEDHGIRSPSPDVKMIDSATWGSNDASEVKESHSSNPPKALQIPDDLPDSRDQATIMNPTTAQQRELPDSKEQIRLDTVAPHQRLSDVQAGQFTAETQTGEPAFDERIEANPAESLQSATKTLPNGRRLESHSLLMFQKNTDASAATTSGNEAVQEGQISLHDTEMSLLADLASAVNNTQTDSYEKTEHLMQSESYLVDETTKDASKKNGINEAESPSVQTENSSIVQPPLPDFSSILVNIIGSNQSDDGTVNSLMLKNRSSSQFNLLKYGNRKAIGDLTNFELIKIDEESHEYLRPLLLEEFEGRDERRWSRMMELRKDYKLLNEDWKAHCRRLDKIKDRIHRRHKPETVPTTPSIDNSGLPFYPEPTTPGPIISGVGRANRRNTNASSFGYGDAVRSEAEFLEILASLETADMRDPNVRASRTAAVVPDMAIDESERRDLLALEDRRRKAVDPVEFYAIHAPLDLWTEDEVQTFCKRFSLHPKQFGKIAAELPDKSTAQCVLFYYRMKSIIDFRSLSDRRGRDGRRRKNRRRVDGVDGGSHKGSLLLSNLQRARVDEPDEEESPPLSPNGAMGSKFVVPETPSVFQPKGNTLRPLAAPESSVTNSPLAGLSSEKGRAFAYNEPALGDLPASEGMLDAAEALGALAGFGGIGNAEGEDGTEMDVDFMEDFAKVRKRPGLSGLPAGSDLKDKAAAAAAARRKSASSSYWSVAERTEFVRLLAVHGKDWTRLADGLHHKTAVQCRNWFQNHAKKLNLTEIAKAADGNMVDDEAEGSTTSGAVTPQTQLVRPGIRAPSALPRAGFFTADDTRGGSPFDADDKSLVKAGMQIRDLLNADTPEQESHTPAGEDWFGNAVAGDGGSVTTEDENENENENETMGSRGDSPFSTSFPQSSSTQFSRGSPNTAYHSQGFFPHQSNSRDGREEYLPVRSPARHYSESYASFPKNYEVPHRSSLPNIRGGQWVSETTGSFLPRVASYHPSTSYDRADDHDLRRSPSYENRYSTLARPADHFSMHKPNQSDIRSEQYSIGRGPTHFGQSSAYTHSAQTPSHFQQHSLPPPHRDVRSPADPSSPRHGNHPRPEWDHMSSYLQDSLVSLLQSTSVIQSLPFRRTQVFTRAALSSEEWFETHLIRDAEPHELSLFTSNGETRYEPVLGGSEYTSEWTATRRRGPKRVGGKEKASPLKERNRGGEDPGRCLLAVKKLLDIYPLPRARDHVNSLTDQHDGLIKEIADLEDSLKRPIPKASSQTSSQNLNEDYYQAAELEQAIKSEQLEIFALEQLHADKQVEVDALAARTRPPKSPARKKSNDVGQTSGKNPFVKSSIMNRTVNAKDTAASKDATPTSSPAKAVPRSGIARSPATKTVKTAEAPSGGSSVARTGSLEKLSTPSPGRKLGLKATSSSTTPRRASGAASILTSDADVTPKGRINIASAAITNRPMSSPRTRVAGVTQADLEVIAAKVWSGVGDAMRPWARRTLVRDGEEVPSPLVSLPLRETLRTLVTILTSPIAPIEPTSPQNSISTYNTLTSEQEDADPSPLSSSALVEFQLLNLLLSTLSGREPIQSTSAPIEGLPPLKVTLRDAVLASSLLTGSSPNSHAQVQQPGRKEPMVSMNALKIWLGKYAKERGWTEEMGTTAIYALVSKTVLRIDRRGKEGPMIGFRN